jgi:hypothetical protein
VRAPFVRCTGVYTRDVYPLYTENEGIVSLACAEDLFVTPAEYESKTPLTLLTEELLLKEMDSNEIALNTHYSKYFDYTPRALDALRTASRKIIKALDIVNDYIRDDRDDRDDREEYANGEVDNRTSGEYDIGKKIHDEEREKVDFIVDTRLPISLESSHDGNVRILKVPNSIDGIPLRVSDRVILRNQRLSENGKYIVVHRDSEKAVLMDVIPINFDTKVKDDAFLTVNLNLNFNLNFNNVDLKPKDVVYVVPLKKVARIVEKNDENEFKLEVLDLVDKETLLKFDKKSRCSDPTISIKELCESPFDSSGSPKTVATWDKPCQRDHECPFFRNSSRGGCTDSGYCEMPLGVTQISYKKYSGTPICHCRGPGDCCSDENRYAFAGDEFE